MVGNRFYFFGRHRVVCRVRHFSTYIFPRPVHHQNLENAAPPRRPISYFLSQIDPLDFEDASGGVYLFPSRFPTPPGGEDRPTAVLHSKTTGCWCCWWGVLILKLVPTVVVPASESSFLSSDEIRVKCVCVVCVCVRTARPFPLSTTVRTK